VTETGPGFRPYLDGHYDASLQLQMHVYRRSEEHFAAGERRRDALTTPEQIVAWQAHLRTVALAALGGLPPDDTPLEAETVGELDGDGCIVEKLIFQSAPGVHVTANVYRPLRLAGRTGAVLFLCGHAEAAKSYPFYQAACQRLARNGLVALAMDPIGQGERKSYLARDGAELVRWGVPEHTYAGVQCWWLGQSIARYFVHDARRAIDYLVGRPEVDAARIGVTGNSGGGTQATWLMLLEPRLAAAAPGTYVMARRDYMWTGQAQDAEQIIAGGTAAGLDHEDFLIAMAPRPVLVLAVDYDFFNVEATVRTVGRASAAYRVLGVEGKLGLARAKSTHEYHPDLARAATAFFVEHLGEPDRPIDHDDPRPLAEAALRCTRSGQVLLDRPETRRVFDLNLDAYRALRPAVADPAATRDWLERQVRRDRRPAEPYARWLPGPDQADARVDHVYWWVEADLLGAGVLLRPREGDFAELVVALFADGSADLAAERAWIAARLAAGQAVFALDVRGTGALRPHRINPQPLDGHYGTLYKLETDLYCLGDSLLAGRLYDVSRALELLRRADEVGLGGRRLGLFGAGGGGPIAYLAGALDPAIARVELREPLLDLDRLLSTRLYPVESWRTLLPGLAAQARLEELRPLFDGRELLIGAEAGVTTTPSS
jgi:cephalosporin-C deacetylase-like acetyl esterase